MAVRGAALDPTMTTSSSSGSRSCACAAGIAAADSALSSTRVEESVQILGDSFIDFSFFVVSAYSYWCARKPAVARTKLFDRHSDYVHCPHGKSFPKPSQYLPDNFTPASPSGRRNLPDGK